MSDLKQLIQEGEHQRQDFKMRIDDQKKIARTLCAFANSGGGRLLIGVKDNGKVVGVDPNEEFFMVEGAAEMFCNPPVKFKSTVLQDDYKLVLMIEVLPSDLIPHKAPDESGKWTGYMRVADQTLVANKIQEKVWQKKRFVTNRPDTLGEDENRILQIFEEQGLVNIGKLYRQAGLPLKTVDKLLVLLICWDIVDIYYENGEVLYRKSMKLNS